MTSAMLEHFNTSTRQGYAAQMSNSGNSAMIPSSGYLALDNSVITSPIFTKNKMNITMPHSIQHMSICNNRLVLVMANKTVFRMHLSQIDGSDEVELEKFCGGMQIGSIFQDPLGVHLLISLVPKSTQMAPELLYLHNNQKRPKKMDRFRDHEITSVAFNYDNISLNSTGPILLGTSKGLILEAEFSVENDKNVQSNWKQVFELGNEPVTGLEFFRVPDTNNYVILATTSNRFYKFQETVKQDGRSIFQAIFSAYLDVPADMRDFHEITKPSKCSTTKLRVCYDNKSNFPRSFGWITDSGIFFGEMDALSETPAHIVSNANIPFPEFLDSNLERKYPAPLAFVLSDFHVLLVFKNRLCAVSTLNYQKVYEEYIKDEFGQCLNVVRDPKTNTLYAYSTKVIYRVKVTNENRNVWKDYLDKGEYEYALKYANDNKMHRDIILTKQAEMCFDSKDYKKSAELYAETKASFEGVCLKFLQANENFHLITFLKKKLVDLSSEDKIQITILVVWLVELHLTEMARNADNPDKTSTLQSSFDQLMTLTHVVECLKDKTKRTVIYDLIASHGDNHNLAKLTAVNEDFESVINHYINQNKFVDALKILKRQRQPELFYKYSPILMEDIPKETIHAMMELKDVLDPAKLMPSLICLNTQLHIDEVIRYLEFSIHSLGCVEQAIHNYLIKMYSEFRKDKLMMYLETQGNDISEIRYDRHYAIRICMEASCNEASVFLQCLNGMWHQAVELALTFDESLAEQKASMPKDSDLRRKLWLRIAEHKIKDKNDNVSEALKLLKTCDLLRIEDILPLFSDFHKIDDFKEAICDALKEYNLKIQEQKKDMEESAKSADRVREDLQSFKNRSIRISSLDLCSICASHILIRPFFIFPCGHKFHHDCLEKQTLSQVDKRHGQRVAYLKNRLNPESPDYAKIKTELESALAGECLFCGEAMINAIDQPFINDWDKINADWE